MKKVHQPLNTTGDFRPFKCHTCRCFSNVFDVLIRPWQPAHVADRWTYWHSERKLHWKFMFGSSHTGQQAQRTKFLSKARSEISSSPSLQVLVFVVCFDDFLWTFQTLVGGSNLNRGGKGAGASMNIVFTILWIQMNTWMKYDYIGLWLLSYYYAMISVSHTLEARLTTRRHSFLLVEVSYHWFCLPHIFILCCSLALIVSHIGDL